MPFALKKFLKKIFSVTNVDFYRVITVFGFSIKYINEKKISKLSSFNKKDVNKKITQFFKSGCLHTQTYFDCIVSLTTYPPRIPDLSYTLYSLFNQTIKPKKIVLWLAEEEFPNKLKELPEKILKFQEKGLIIKFTKNIKSYKKLIPALKEFPHDVIITADDDAFYPIDWLEKLIVDHNKNKDAVIAHRVRKIIFDEQSLTFGPYMNWPFCSDDSCSCYNFFTGLGGILYPPCCFYDDVLNEELFMKLCPTADDIWFWAMAVLNNKQIKVVTDPNNNVISTNWLRNNGYTEDSTLFSVNKLQNDVQLQYISAYYPQILQILKSNAPRFDSGTYWENR